MTETLQEAETAGQEDPDPIVKSGVTKAGNSAIYLTKSGDIHLEYQGGHVDRQRDHERLPYPSFKEGNRVYTDLAKDDAPEQESGHHSPA